MTSIELASAGSLAATSGSPSCAVTDSSTDLRSSVTTPPVVETNSPSSSIRAISLLCAAALASTNSCWTLGSESAFSTTLSAALRIAPATGPASGASLRGKPIGELGLDVDVVEDRGDDEGVERRLDVGVLDQLLAGRGPGLGLEQLALGPEREDRDDRDDRREDDDDDRQRPAAGLTCRLRRLGGVLGSHRGPFWLGAGRAGHGRAAAVVGAAQPLQR